MSRQRLIMGNWKMNGDAQSIQALVKGIETIEVSANISVAVFPPFVYLEKVRELLQHSRIKLGAQNVSIFDNGAYTGEISVAMLKDLKCEYVILGHSERRQFYAETNDVVAKKVQQVLQAGLKAILCVGETLQEREQQKTQQIVLAQLESVLNLSANIDLSNLIIAYEPIWAIGTGITATPEQAQEVHQLLRTKLAAQIPIIYGGSVKAANAKQLFSMPDIDGALIGGASLIVDEFRQLCHLAETE